MRIVVDLPAPLGPRKPCASPSATLRSRPSSARVAPKVLTRSLISMVGIIGSFVLVLRRPGDPCCDSRRRVSQPLAAGASEIRMSVMPVSMSDAELEAARRRGFGVAYRMLGSVSEAEDVAQEAVLRLARAEEPIDEPTAWITTVATRLSIGVLRSARRRRETYVGPWLPEPRVATDGDAAHEVELADSLSQAFLVMLESAIETVTMPGRSTRRGAVSSRDSRVANSATKTARTATGRLRRKIDCQETCSTRKPPITGPIASAAALTPAQVPIALPRSRGGNAFVMIESVAGIMNAAPTPCTARNAMSHASV